MRHLAIIADGNRRWTKQHNLPEGTGHVRGLEVIEHICEWAISRDVLYLTMYCFSTENWSRSEDEVQRLTNLARWYFSDSADWYIEHDIRVLFSGRRDRFPADIIESMDVLSSKTECCKKLTLIICADYGGRDEICRAIANGARTEEEITTMLCANAPEPDVILRTGGMHRLSNFLLWQSAYAELFFTDTLFPAIEDSELDEIYERAKYIITNHGK